MCKICTESNTGIWKLQVICMVKHSEHWKLLFQLLGFLSSHIKTNEESLEGVFSLLLYIFMIFCQYTIKQFLNNSLNIKTENSVIHGKHYASCHFPQRSGKAVKAAGSSEVWETLVSERMTKTMCLLFP